MRPKGLAKTGGRRPGVTNKIAHSAKTILSEKITDEYVKAIFETIEKVENPTERVRLKIRLLEFVVPKPRDSENIEAENEFRRAFMDRMYPKKL